MTGLPRVKEVTKHHWESCWKTNVSKCFNVNVKQFHVHLSLSVLTVRGTLLSNSLSTGYLAAFREFLKSEFSEENLEFWLACQDYREFTPPTSRFLRATEIYREFLHPMAMREVRTGDKQTPPSNKLLLYSVWICRDSMTLEEIKLLTMKLMNLV